MLVILAFVLNNTLILGIWCSAIPPLPGCFCPWTFFQSIGFNMVPSDTFMAHLATQFGYFCRGVSGFATDCPCDVWCRGLPTCLLHVGPPNGNRFLNISWAVGLTYWIVYLDFFCILSYAIIYVLIHHAIFGFYLYFLSIPYPEPVYTGWSSVHWNATGMPLVDPVYTGTPLEKLSWNSPTLECHWRILVESAPHWDATGETLTFTAYTGTPLDGLCQPTPAPTHIV